jgi:hypothetical protein
LFPSALASTATLKTDGAANLMTVRSRTWRALSPMLTKPVKAPLAGEEQPPDGNVAFRAYGMLYSCPAPERHGTRRSLVPFAYGSTTNYGIGELVSF